MNTFNRLTVFLKLSLILLCYNFSYGQMEDSPLSKKDTLTLDFQKVILDGRVSYLNKKTMQFISPSAYLALSEQDAHQKIAQEEHQHTHSHSYDYWESDKVNPYRDVLLPTPFKIEFDQSTFTHPVYGAIVITSRFGARRRGPHRGLDIDLLTGDPVRSVLPGKVRFVGYSRGHGKTVVVRHANDVETVYAHLSAYQVKVNDIIYEGQILGLGGNTGNSRGSHLHLEVRYKGVCIHPEYVFNFDGSRTIRSENLWVTNAWKSPRAHSSYRKSKLVTISSEEEAIAMQEAEPKYHRVRKGDTLSHIARNCSLGVREICSLNGISKKSTLKIGQMIQIQ